MSRMLANSIIAQCAYAREGEMTPSKSLVYDLFMDSVMLTELACELENAFKIRILEDEIVKMECVQDIYALLEQRGITLDDTAPF